jgi:hypothetical protein
MLLSLAGAPTCGAIIENEEVLMGGTYIAPGGPFYRNSLKKAPQYPCLLGYAMLKERGTYKIILPTEGVVITKLSFRG